MKSYESKWFAKWSKKNGLTNDQLLEALSRVDAELGVVDLDGHIYKVRIGKNNQGRSGGYRTILAFKANKRSIFLFGFEKNDQENIDKSQLLLYKEYAKTFMGMTESEIQSLVDSEKILILEKV